MNKYSILILIGMVLCGAALQAQPKPDLFVLSVGVKNYNNSDYNLKYPDLDAIAVANAWALQTILYEPHTPILLIDEKATQDEIRNALRSLQSKTTDEDLVVFFFSGHGKSHGLCPWDFEAEREYPTAFNYLELRELLRALPCNYVVLLDACFSASFGKVMAGKNTTVDNKALPDINRKSVEDTWRSLAQPDKQTLILCSSASNKESDEDDILQHGYFTQAVLNCMAGRAVQDPANNRVIYVETVNNGFVATDQFAKYVKEASRALAVNNTFKQSGFSAGMLGVDFPLIKIINSTPSLEDGDHDGFPDGQDDCLNIPGSLKGCPDGDGDGVPDKSDVCPYQPGTPLYAGCPPPPDTDKDGLPDDKDLCPSLWGKIDWQGCPDSDNDGVPDHKDKCPSEKGIPQYDGCKTPIEEAPPILEDTILGTFVLVKGGTFKMGCQDDSCTREELPAHLVTLDDFYICKTEVTQSQWLKIMKSNPSHSPRCGDCPVDQVSWDDVQVFLSRINNRAGGAIFRLPTEAEWEYAARGGSKSKDYLFSGSNDIDDVAWYYGNSEGDSWPVMEQEPNELGLYDMTGNVWEWCADWYGEYSQDSLTNPHGPPYGTRRVTRGGSYSNTPKRCHITDRFLFEPSSSYVTIGLRLARSIPK